MKLPKYNLLYYKALIDKCFVKFFKDFNSEFTNVNGDYVLSENINKAKLKHVFKTYLAEEIKQYVRPYSLTDPDYFLIIGSCMPQDNLLLKFKDNAYFPEKLSKLILSRYQIKYFMKEKDIKIDLVKFNQVLIEIFQELFTSHKKILSLLGNEYKNVFFVLHSLLDCYSMFKTIKHIYGKSNCWNIYKEKLNNFKSPIVAVNDLIDLYVHNKVKMNKSKEFKKIVDEVKQFINETISLEI